jgi:hypothetical protein
MGLSVLVALVLIGSASASAAKPASISAPQIPRPPIPIVVKNLFKAKPPPLPKWRPSLPRPSVVLPRSVPRLRLRVDVFTLRTARNTADARNALRRIFNRDQYERFSVHAFCWGADQLADYWSDPNAYFSERTWASIFYDFLRSNVENYVVPKAVQVVNGWLNGWDMAQIHPRLAYFYFRACYG